MLAFKSSGYFATLTARRSSQNETQKVHLMDVFYSVWMTRVQLHGQHTYTRGSFSQCNQCHFQSSVNVKLGLLPSQ